MEKFLVKDKDIENKRTEDIQNLNRSEHEKNVQIEIEGNNDKEQTIYSLRSIKNGESMDIIRIIDTGKQELALQNRSRLTPIIDAILVCGIQGIALRGHRDSGAIFDNDNNNNDDFTGPIDSFSWLVGVVAHSKWVDVGLMRDTTSTTIIRVLRNGSHILERQEKLCQIMAINKSKDLTIRKHTDQLRKRDVAKEMGSQGERKKMMKNMEYIDENLEKVEGQPIEGNSGETEKTDENVCTKDMFSLPCYKQQ
ncbi:unnamed protein product [Gordionus sp. m RMFG-2023]